MRISDWSSDVCSPISSLLPRWRGAAPIQRAIWAGDNVTGVTIMDMEAGLDTGPMRAKHVTPIEDKPAGVLTAELARAGAGRVLHGSEACRERVWQSV